MADIVAYYAGVGNTRHTTNESRGFGAPHFGTSIPVLMGSEDLNEWNSDCTCATCRTEKGVQPEPDVGNWRRYNYITKLTHSKLTKHQYLLCPDMVPAFVFKTRSWGESMSRLRGFRAG